MDQKPTSSFITAGLLAGLVGGVLLTAIGLVARRAWETPFVPELMAEALFAAIPMGLFSLFIRLLGLASKYVAFAGMIALYLILLASLGGLFARAFSRLPGLGPMTKGVGFALAIWAGTVGAGFPLLGAGFAGLGAASGAPLALAATLGGHLVYGCALGVAARRWAVSPGKQAEGTDGDEIVRAAVRRGVLRRMVGGLVLAGAWPVISGAAKKNQGASKPPAPEVPFPDVKGLGPEVTPADKFYVISKNLFDPNPDAGKWRLEVKGLVERPFILTVDQVKALPSVSLYNTLECISNEVGGPLMGNAQWKGVPLKDLLAQAGLKGKVVDIVLHASEGYTDSIPLPKALEPTTIVAYEMNGAPLTAAHGYPARLIVPGIYGMKNVKWLTAIEPVDYDYKGFWEKRGWSDEAIVKTTSRIDVPKVAAILSPADPWVAGAAYAGDREIKAVEISVDGGKTWTPAQVKPSLSRSSWALWAWDSRQAGAIIKPGKTTLTVRATDGTGVVQTAAVTPTLPDGASGHHAITVTTKS